MRSPYIIHPSAWTPPAFVSTGSPLAARTFTLQTSAENVVAIEIRRAAVMISSNRIATVQRLSNRRQRTRWLEAQTSALLEPPLTSRAPPRQIGIGASDFVVKTVSAEPRPKPARNERIELAIDSLQNYELIQAIPVLIESLGDKVFVAEAPDLNVSTTGNSVGAAFLLLKEHIVTTYEGYRSKKGLDSERARQLSIFDKYIGKTKRHWF
jgi:predicted RNase H-like HicB family nuclease